MDQNTLTQFLVIGVLLIGLVTLVGCVSGTSPDKALIDGKLKITIDKVKEGKTVDLETHHVLEEGYKGVALNLTGENIGKEKWETGVLNSNWVTLKIQTEDGTRYSRKGGTSIGSYSGFHGIMPEERITDVKVTFEVLENKTPKYLNFYQDDSLVDYIELPE